MPKITFLPHEKRCPTGKVIAVEEGTSILEAALANDIELEHACGGVAACTTCHIIVQEGFASLEPASEAEEDMLDKAWGLCSQSRLACQARISVDDLSIEIPKYTLNLVSEGH
jgi:ferredoxin, 2Fe-2S